jgi:hypothetical protein
MGSGASAKTRLTQSLIVARGPIQEKIAGVMLAHEEFQHVIKQLAVLTPFIISPF